MIQKIFCVTLISAISSWAALPDAQSFQSLKNQLDQKKSTIEQRWQALQKMAELGSDQAWNQIRKSAKDARWDVRNASVVAAEKMGADKAALLVKDLLQDKALIVRSAAVDVASRLNRQDLREDLWKEFYRPGNFRNGQSLWIRDQIAEFLILHPEQKERKKFVQMLSEPEENLQQRAISALEKMTGIVQSADSSLKENRRLWIQWAQKNETLKL